MSAAEAATPTARHGDGRDPIVIVHVQPPELGAAAEPPASIVAGTAVIGADPSGQLTAGAPETQTRCRQTRPVSHGFAQSQATHLKVIPRSKERQLFEQQSVEVMQEVPLAAQTEGGAEAEPSGGAEAEPSGSAAGPPVGEGAPAHDGTAYPPIAAASIAVDVRSDAQASKRV